MWSFGQTFWNEGMRLKTSMSKVVVFKLLADPCRSQCRNGKIRTISEHHEVGKSEGKSLDSWGINIRLEAENTYLDRIYLQDMKNDWVV